MVQLRRGVLAPSSSASRVVCTASSDCPHSSRTHSTTPPLKYASLANHPCHAATSFSASLPYSHPQHAPPAYAPAFQQPQQVPPLQQHHHQQQQQTTEAHTFYRRELPSNLHSFTSKAGRALFKECVAAGHAEIYFSLSGNFTMQSEPAFCGLGSLAMVLNALTVDPGRRWKGVWRWYSDDMLECTHTPREQIREKGMTFAELACLARCNGLRVVAKRADQVSREQFLKDLARVSASEDTHMVVSFSRKTLGQTGDGHFSPIGAYHPDKNQVLVLDTARFKYPSYFCDADLLYDAMQPIDNETGLPRGYFLLTKGESKPLALCRISVSDLQQQRHDWHRIAQLFSCDLPSAFRLFHHHHHPSDDPINVGTAIPSVLVHILSSLPTSLPFLISLQPPGVDLASATQALANHHATDIITLLENTRSIPLYSHVRDALAHPDLANAFPSSSSQPSPPLSAAEQREVTTALATIFILAAPRELFVALPRHLRVAFEDLRARHALTPLLAGEVDRIGEQLEVLFNSYCNKCNGKGC
ncbi:glutathione gamma-glutamylcysteinyltransferase [Powellomyces hirtus]|nr:glutathione gamma-glutamylcysteinyltransferase [Powellomyces hirtus]